MLTEARVLLPRHLTASLVVLMLALNLSGCGVGYVLQAAHGQWQVVRSRRPIDAVIADPATTAPVRSQLQMAREAREFASRELGLPNNSSYRTYAALGRDYVVWNVVAAPEFSIHALQWCFPVAGCVAYRGYFREAAARKYAAKLASRGNDVLVAGVEAYSTLGRFSDPILDTMLGDDELDLAGTIFHELAHQLIYVKGDSDFNEAFAMSVEQEGVARWLAAHGRTAELEGYSHRRMAQEQIVSRLAAGRDRLAALYAQVLPAPQMRERKQVLISELVASIHTYEQATGLRSGYDTWIDQGLNNAHLASVATYFDCVPAFQQILAAQDGNLTLFYARVRELARGPAPARQALCRQANPASATTAPAGNLPKRPEGPLPSTSEIS
jgi:predicted aminopeptidase